VGVILKAKDITKNFGGLEALSGFDLEVKEGEIVGIIGPNGAGKTTLFNLLTGYLSPTRGRIIFNDQDITNLRPDEIARKGLVRTFQATSIFKSITVLENIVIAHHLFMKAGFWSFLFNFQSYRAKERQAEERSNSILEYMGLAAVKDELAENLPHGYQRALGIAIAAAAEPKLLLLDEPATGMNQMEIDELMNSIRGLREKGMTLMIVEHDMRAIMGISDRIVVLDFGQRIAEGLPEEIQRNEKVIKAYLGTEEG
jgi:branched-chain amino acid transport system ATP-binding protein